MGWQIFDTDFHFLRNVLKSKIYKRKKPVIIGDNVFIGNSSTIGKEQKYLLVVLSLVAQKYRVIIVKKGIIY